MKKLARWVGIFFLTLAGIAFWSTKYFVPAMCFFLMAFLMTSLANKLLQRTIHKTLPLAGKIVVAVILFFAAIVGTPSQARVQNVPQPEVLGATQTQTPDQQQQTGKVESEQAPSETASPSPQLSPSPSPTPTPSPSPKVSPTPKPTAKPTPKPTPAPTIRVSSTPQPTIAPQPIAPPTTSGWACNCSKTCPQMSSCSEAQYQLNNCGCSARDADHDGVACDADCQ